MNECSRLRKRLEHALRPDELDDDHQVQAHLAECERCRQWWRGELETRRVLATLGGSRAPAGLERAVMSRVWSERLRPRLQVLRLRVAAVGTAAVAVTAAAVLYFGGIHQPAMDSPDLNRMLQAHVEASAGGVTGDSGLGAVGEVEGLF